MTVAGAGVLGLTCALTLAQRGCRVTVQDPALPLVNASGVAAGMLAPALEAALDAEARDHFDLLLAARNLWPALEARAGLSVDRTGTLAAGRSVWTAQAAAALSGLGLFATDLPRRAARNLAPGLAQDLESVLLSREDWRVDAADALQQLRAAAQAADVRFSRERCAGRGDSDLLLIATGAGQDLAPLAPELAALSPIKGHILRAELADATVVTVRGESGYAAPASGGLALGATMERGVADPAVDAAKAGPLAEAGAKLFPAVASAPQSLQAGVRGATPDGLPMVGPSSTAGVMLAVGARRNGWLLAPLVAEVVAAQVLDRDPGPYADRLEPSRFTARG